MRRHPRALRGAAVRHRGHRAGAGRRDCEFISSLARPLPHLTTTAPHTSNNTQGPYQNVFLQEMDVMNALLAEMARSLRELQLGAFPGKWADGCLPMFAEGT